MLKKIGKRNFRKISLCSFCTSRQSCWEQVKVLYIYSSWSSPLSREPEEILNLWIIAEPQKDDFLFLPDPVKKPLVNFPLAASLLEVANWGSLLSTESIYNWQNVLQHCTLKNALPCIQYAEGCTSAIACPLAIADFLCDKPFRLQGNHHTPNIHTQYTSQTIALCSLFLTAQKNWPPGTPVLIPKLGSKGVIAHIPGARANFGLIMGYFQYQEFSSAPIKHGAAPLGGSQCSINSKTLLFHFNFSNFFFYVPVF